MIGNAPTSYVRSVLPLDLARCPGLTGRFLGPCLRFLAMGISFSRQSTIHSRFARQTMLAVMNTRHAVSRKEAKNA